MKKLLSLPIITVYLYILTVVALYGFNSYFNIPSNYIEFSVRNHIIFFFDLARLAVSVCEHVTMGAWLGIGFALLFLLALCFSGKIMRWLIIIGLGFFAVYLPFGFYRFGGFMAAVSTSFYTAPSSCISGATEDLYVAPTLFESKIVFVPIDAVTHKLKNGLLVREMSAVSCQLEKKEIGKVQK